MRRSPTRCAAAAPAQRSHVAQIFHAAVCGAAAEECALAVGRDVDVEEAGDRVACALDPARVHAAFGEMLENVVAEAVAAAQPVGHVDAPARESQCGVCAYSAAVHFELGREAVLAWFPARLFTRPSMSTLMSPIATIVGFGWGVMLLLPVLGILILVVFRVALMRG